MNYYDQIKNIIIDTEVYDKVKDYSKNRNRVNSYYEIGKLLSEAGSVYEENIIGKYAEKLVNDVGNKYNERTLRRIRQFYIIFCFQLKNGPQWGPNYLGAIREHYYH